MNPIAVFIRHKTLPGKRQHVLDIWMRHMAPAVSNNVSHLAYFYCTDANDEDAICAFQQYRSSVDAKAFLETAGYRSYLEEVEPFLVGPPQVTTLNPIWSKP